MRITLGVLVIAASATLASAALIPNNASLQAAPSASIGAQNQSVGVTVVSDDAKVDVMANGLASRVGEDAARIAARLRRMRAQGGPSLYIQMHHARAPFQIEIVPDDRSGVYMPLRGLMMVGQVPDEADPRQSVVMFWVLNGRDERFRLTVPSTYRNIAIVVNGREVVNRPLNAAAGSRTYTVR